MDAQSRGKSKSGLNDGAKHERKQRSLNVPDDVHDRVKRYADEHGMKQYAVVRKAMDKLEGA